ncbi:MAG TPA: phosphoglycerate dehydrogenase [Isosphaeraceae bacterium]|jgi:phosphoglycerate dehydrogenase-like enzyme|nr:phosphoglycerate dehydrogenase [Isosphaeraceae bacterium]
MPTVLIGPAPLRNRPGHFREILERAGFTTLDVEGNNTLTPDQLNPALPKIDAMVAGGELLSAEALDLAPRLRAIARTGVGYDTIDMAAATARKMVVTITPGTNHDSVAEQTFSLLLAITRNVVNNDRVIRAGGYDRSLVLPLRGKTMGLVGMGRIGRAVATRAIAFGMRVIAHDTVADATFDAQHGIRRVSLDDLIAQADVISLHVPLTDSTRGMINRDSLARMRQGAILLNTARGGLIVESDLAEALSSGHLAGAGLDVQQQEPPRADNPLLRLQNVVLSPHIGGIDAQAMADMAEMAAECIVALYQGRWPADCVVNKELAGGWTW